MKTENLLQEMYREIQMNGEQKDRIWKEIKTRSHNRKAQGKGVRPIPAFAALCTCLVFLIGAPVLAANTSVLERITGAFYTLSGTKEDLTEEQKSVYEKYGVIMDEAISLTGHTVTLEAVIYDGYDICIPFSITSSGRAENAEKKPSDETQSQMALADMNSLQFYLPDHKAAPQTYILLDEPDEQGKISGCCLLSSEEKLRAGDTLVIQRQAETEEAPHTVCTLTMESPVESSEILSKVDRIVLENKATVDSICFSPLSLHVTGTAPNPGVGNAVYSGRVTVEKKDGSEIMQTHSGCSRSLRDNETNLYTYGLEILFTSPADLEDLAGIRIQNGSLDLWIPLTADKKRKRIVSGRTL